MRIAVFRNGKCHCLAALIRRAFEIAGCPACHALCSRVFTDTVWSAPFVNEGAISAVDSYYKSLLRRCIRTSFEVPPSSLSLTLIVDVPLAFTAGVYVSVPLVAIAGATLNNVGLLFSVTANVNVWPLSSAGPFDIAVAQLDTVCAPESSNTVWSAPFVNDGASFTGVIFTVNVVKSVSPPGSVTVSVILTVRFDLVKA
jgi:hypothetical protein